MSSGTSTSLNVILGAVVVAGIFGALFFGGACIQTYNYFHTYRFDYSITKGAVAALWAVNAFHFAVYTYTIWYYVVDALDTAWIPQIMDWSFKVFISIASLSVWLAVALVLLLDIFYTIYMFTRPSPSSHIVPSLTLRATVASTFIVPALVALTVVAGNILGVRIIIFTHFTNIYGISSSALIYLFFGLFCVKSTAIAGAMTYYLRRSNAGFTRESNTSIRRGVKLVVGSSLFVAVCSYCVLACHLAMPHSMSCVVVYMIVSKAYHNCFLSLLTCRDFADCGIAYGRNPNFSHQDYIKRRSKRSSNLDMAVQKRSTVVGGASIDMQREGEESKV
ncbi:hypothetical protein B0H14DRAFT_2598148 [Mycena olivaceomarginata]|nr:hypothetical protein B0H14DRAFT_2598148 [Mycena olivaceomarginata]